MRCRRLRTVLWTCRQSVAFQSVGPLALFAASHIQHPPRSALFARPFGQCTRFASAAFRRGHLRCGGPIRWVMALVEGAGSPYLSVPGLSFSNLPVPAGGLSLSYNRPAGDCSPDPIGVSTFRMKEMRLGWVPPLRRGPGVRSWERESPGSIDPSSPYHLSFR
jgi:hypothetical protein